MLAISMMLAMLCRINSDRIDNYVSQDIPYIKKRKVDKSLCKVLAFLSAFPILLITCFRYRVGTDYMYYAESVRRVQDGKKSYFSNPIYRLLEKIASAFPGYIAIFCVDRCSPGLQWRWMDISGITINKKLCVPEVNFFPCKFF